MQQHKHCFCTLNNTSAVVCFLLYTVHHRCRVLSPFSPPPSPSLSLLRRTSPMSHSPNPAPRESLRRPAGHYFPILATPPSTAFPSVTHFHWPASSGRPLAVLWPSSDRPLAALWPGRPRCNIADFSVRCAARRTQPLVELPCARSTLASLSHPPHDDIMLIASDSCQQLSLCVCLLPIPHVPPPTGSRASLLRRRLVRVPSKTAGTERRVHTLKRCTPC